MEFGVTKVIPQRCCEGNKIPTVQWGSVARKLISGHKCDSNGTGRAPLRGCIGLHLSLYTIHSNATVRRYTMLRSSKPPVKKLAPLTARFSSLGHKLCLDAAVHHTTEQHSRMGRTKPRINYQDEIYYLINVNNSLRYHAFERLPWKPIEDASRKSYWNKMSMTDALKSSGGQVFNHVRRSGRQPTGRNETQSTTCVGRADNQLSATRHSRPRA